MKKRILLTLPLILSCLSLFGCEDTKVTKLNASVPSTNIYRRAGSISKDDISVVADLSGGGTKVVASKDWTSDKFGSNTTYTFTTSGTNTIDVKYEGQSYNLTLTVYPKGSTDFTFKDAGIGLINMNINEEKVIEIQMNEAGAEVDISTVEWSIGELYDKDIIQITPDSNNKFKCTVKALKAGVAGINTKATDNVQNSKTHSLDFDVKGED